MTKLPAPLVLAVLATVCAACTNSGPSDAPSRADVTTGTVTSGPLPSLATITFNGLSALGTCSGSAPPASCAVTSYSEAGVNVAVVSQSWVALTSFGNPAPFIEFRVPAGTTATGELRVTADAGTFSFQSIDLYSSTTSIPYTITGLRNGGTVVTLSGTVPSSQGKFRTVTSTTTSLVDTLSIVLTDPAFPCCANPIGVDNLVVIR